jgi:hypothetical protein
MELVEIWGGELVHLWVEKSVGSRESFGYLISDFLNRHPDIHSAEDVRQVLTHARRIAGKVILEHPDDLPLNLSYKAFTSAIDQFINALK